MAIETIHTRPNRNEHRTAGVVDVSELPTARVRDIADGEDVHLERRGGRTFLVPA